MAKGTSIEKLYFSLGLDISELGSDFIAAEQTVSQNLARLNRENNLIRMRMQVDTAGLDPVKDAQKIIEIQTKALNQQLQIQKDRLALATAAWQDYVKNQGATATSTQRAEQAMLRERLAIQQIEQELRQLNATSRAPNGRDGNTLLSGYTHMRDGISSSLSEITSRFNELSAAASSTDRAITSSLSTISALRHPAAMAAAALAALPIVAHALQTELVDLARPAISAGDAAYILSRRMATTTAEAGAFSNTCKAMGADTNLVLSSLERMSKQVLTAGANGNAATKAFRAFGIELVNEDGRLKSHHERMLALAEGFDRARKAGQQMELQNILIKNGMGDMVTAIEDYRETYDKVQNHLVKSGLADPKLAHELQGELNLLEMQKNQLKGAFSAVLMPVAQDLVPKLTETFAKLTEVIAENKDTIRDWGQAASDILSGVGNAAENVANIIGTITSEISKVNQNKLQEIIDDESIQTLDDFIRKRSEQKGTDVDYMFKANPSLKSYAESFYEGEWKKVLEARQNAKEKAEKEIKGEQEEESSPEEKLLLSDEELASIENQKKHLAELEELRYKRTHSTIENEIYDIERWRDKTLQSVAETGRAEEERQAIIELAEEKISAARSRAEKESRARADAYLREAREATSDAAVSAYDKELRKIDEWKEQMQEKAYLAEEVSAIEEAAAAKAARAYETEMERVKNATKSFQDEIFSLTHSQYENDMKKALDRYREGIKQGLDKSTLDQWLQLKVSDINAQAGKRGKDYMKAPNSQPQYIQEWGKKSHAPSVMEEVQSALSGTTDEFRHLYDVINGDKISAFSSKIEQLNGVLTEFSIPGEPQKDAGSHVVNSNNNITVQVDNVNADSTEQVDRAAMQIADAVRKELQSAGSQYGYGR